MATRARIIAAAELLFARHGIDAVSLSQVNRAARQRNRNAVQYHFGGKSGLVDAILAKHELHIDQRRNQMLDELEAGPGHTLRDVTRALVVPVAERLEDENGGVAFVQLRAQLLGHPEFRVLEGRRRPPAGVARVWRMAARLAPPLPPALRFPRYLAIMGLLFHALADYARIAPADPEVLRGTTRESFVESLIDSIAAVLATPPSEAALRATEAASARG